MKKTGILNVDHEKYNLDLTIYPSLNYSLINKNNNDYIIYCGRMKGARLKLTEKGIEYSGLTQKQALEITGLWYNIEKESRQLTKKYKRLIDELTNVYGCVGLSINTIDKDLIFISSYLSRNTDFHKNVARWINYICKCGINQICLANSFKKFKSYQLENLVAIYKKFLETKGKIHNVTSLLSIPNVGSKVILCYLLFSSRIGKYYAPPDVNYQALVKNLSLFRKYTLPNKKYCYKYLITHCHNCELGEYCIVGLSTRFFKGTSGWVQTIFYIHSKTYCRKKLCMKCPIKNLCKKQ